MPISVPKEPKVYTTKYDNFRGVDFTNDPSNVWRHRSPNAKNMTPDIAGRPWKRTGWEIVKDAQAFRDVYNTAKGYSEGDPDYYDGVITPVKTSYFELGGVDYLAISNNLGLFIYSKFIDGNITPTLSKESPYLMFIKSYHGEIGSADENTEYQKVIVPDANRSFFFEGQGKAGFYVFCTLGVAGSKETALMRFDGEVLRRVVPHVPTIVFAKGPGDNGGGTMLESANILTLERIVMCTGNGSGKDFILPELADTGKTLTVEVMSGGTWDTKVLTTDYTVDSTYRDKATGESVTKVSFTNAPAAPDVTGEDNIRITYSVYGSNVGERTLYYTSYIAKGSKVEQRRTLTYVNNSLTSTTPWANYGSATSMVSRCRCYLPNAVLTNNVPDVKIKLKTDADTWSVTPIAQQYVQSSYVAYSTILTVYTAQTSGYYSYQVTETSNPTELSSNVTTSSSSSGFSAMDVTTVRTVVQKRYVTTWARYPCRIEAQQRTYSSSPERNAFEQCSRATVYGDGLINSVFLSATTADAYKSRVWWSMQTDPSYFPDTNYIEAGSNDTQVAGMMKVGEYLGIIKQGQSMDSTIYLAYPTKVASGEITDGTTTTTTYDDTYAVKSSIGGIGAISNGAFNILNDEPLFLSKNGVMGINPTNENEKQLRNRSFFINKKLKEEGMLENAISFVWRNMYILALNNHCYILDGSQKTSWANEKTNLQYECYYWDNVPAQCFARYNEELWFTDFDGRLCRFKEEGNPASYHDDYDTTIGLSTAADIPFSVLASNPDVTVTLDFATFWSQIPQTGQFLFTYGSAGYLHRTLLGHDFGNSGHLDVNSSPRAGDSIVPYLHDSEGWHINGEVCTLADYGIAITGDSKPNDVIMVNVGNPIHARWTTVFDDDGSAHYFKTLQKKGTMVSLYPQSSTGVRVYIKRDNEAEIYTGTATVRGSNDEIVAPSDFYLKKKAKKYKRLQIIAENDGFDESFGIDEIIKCYTIGNYSRNR